MMFPKVDDVGEYVREQRRNAQLSLRQLADVAGVSHPHLSEIERGLRKPSAEVLQQIVRGLRISGETRAVILADPLLDGRQKQVVLQIYESFLRENWFGIGAVDKAVPPNGGAPRADGRGGTAPAVTVAGGTAEVPAVTDTAGADPLAEVVAWALEHLHEQFGVETLAARALMSRRTFDRRFGELMGSSPLQWLLMQRVLLAQRLLEMSDYSVDEIADRCGFRSPAAFRRLFRQQLGSSPAKYRAASEARRSADGTDPRTLA